MNLKLILIFLSFPLALSAQITFNTPEGEAIAYLTKTADRGDNDVNGTPYLNPGFQKGEVFINDSLEIIGELRYNAYKSEIEILDNANSFFSLLKRPYITAGIADRLFKMYNYKDVKNLDRVAYFNPLNDGDVVLLFKPEIKIKRGKEPSTSYDRYMPPSFIDISSYYIKIGDKTAHKIRLRKKSFLKLLKDKSSEVSAYIRQKDLKLTEETDAVQLLDYYNNL